MKESSVRKREIKYRRYLLTAVLLLLVAFVLSACGEQRSSGEIIEEIAVYRGHYGAEADQKIEKLFKELEKADPEECRKWKTILDRWDAVENDLDLHYDVLPDGLPQTDELCIIALGFQLYPDGRMKEELIGRLEVVKKSAEKYPNALIICTGGGTAAENPQITEAGQMKMWLAEHGIPQGRIIAENQSITTAQNAMYSYDILVNDYPQVTQLAIISSDYHIATGELLFEAESILKAEQEGGERMHVVSNAAYKAPSGTLSSLFQAGALIELSGDRDTAFDIYYEEYDIHELPPLN